MNNNYSERTPTSQPSQFNV